MNAKEFTTHVSYTRKDVTLDNVPAAYHLFALAGEVGEVINKVKKIARDHDGIMTIADQEEIIDELGDCLWYITATALDIDHTLEDVMEGNVRKLKARRAQLATQPTGTSTTPRNDGKGSLVPNEPKPAYTVADGGVAVPVVSTEESTVISLHSTTDELMLVDDTPPTFPYEPDYAVHPSTVIKERMEANGITNEVLAYNSYMTLQQAEQLINGETDILPSEAFRIGHVIGIDPGILIRMQRRYDEHVARDGAETPVADENDAGDTNTPSPHENASGVDTTAHGPTSHESLAAELEEKARHYARMAENAQKHGKPTHKVEALRAVAQELTNAVTALRMVDA